MTRRGLASPHDRAIATAPAYRLPDLAAHEFQRRRAHLSRLVAEGRLDGNQADERLRPWLAMAAAAGADLPELEVAAINIFPGTGHEMQRLAAAEICPRADWHAALAKARDAALAALTPDAPPAREADARSLTDLCRGLGVSIPVQIVRKG